MVNEKGFKILHCKEFYIAGFVNVYTTVTRGKHLETLQPVNDVDLGDRILVFRYVTCLEILLLSWDVAYNSLRSYLTVYSSNC